MLTNMLPFINFIDVMIPDSLSKLSYLMMNMLGVPASIGDMVMGRK